MYLFITVNQDGVANIYLSSKSALDINNQKKFKSHRRLAENLLKEIVSFLKDNDLTLNNVSGIGVFAGPYGFTDLRVVHTIANSLAYSLNIPVVNSDAKDWLEDCFSKLDKGLNMYIIKPNYGKDIIITKQKK